jgi:TonB-linked SusC/RagA family outer membrane protein
MVNPDDIESVSVLKDAASASIYGAKAAFGVVLIKSKKGAKLDGVSVSYSGNLAFSNISKKMEMGKLDAMEYSLLAAERIGMNFTGSFWRITRDGFEKAKQWEQRFGSAVKPEDPMLYGRDWYVDANGHKIGLRTYDPYDYMVREWAPTHTHNVSVNGMSGKTNYYISFGAMDQQGINKPAKKDDFQRYNASIRVQTAISDKLKVFAGAIYSTRRKNYPFTTASTTVDPWLYLYRWAPNFPLTTEGGDKLRNTVAEMQQANTALMKINYTSMNGGFVLNPIDNWEIKLDYTHANEEYIHNRPGTRYFSRGSWWDGTIPLVDDNGNQIFVNDAGEQVSESTPGAIAARRLSQPYYYTGKGANPDRIYRQGNNTVWNTLNITTSYDLNFNDEHVAKVLLGMNSVGMESGGVWGQKTELVDLSNPQFSLATGTQTAGGSEYWESQLGFFGRVNYNYKEKYLVEANLRYDGASKFPTSLQWRWFPSFSVGWRLSNESFMDWTSEYLDMLKVRASWGTIGDQSVPPSLYIPSMSGSSNNWIVGGSKLYQFSTPPAVSDAITWQDVTTLDVGMDLRMFNNSFGIIFDWFRRDTENMLVPQEGIPVTLGTGAPVGNNGSLRTNGFEIQADYNYRFANGLGVNVTATFADAITKITKYGTSNSIDSWYVGKEYGEIWGYETDRLYQAEDFVYDADGNIVTTTSSDGYTVNQLADADAATQGKLQGGGFIFGPGDVKFVDLNGDGVINDGSRLLVDADGNPDYGDLKKIGNFTPRYEYSFRLGLDYKGFDASVFMQGVGKRDMWGSSFLVIPGFNTFDGAMPQEFAGNFWKEDRTDAFYPRPWNLWGGTGGNMHPQSRYLLDMSYLRIKNITFGYTLPQLLSQKVFMKKLRIYVSLENFFTFDKLGTLPIDPEEISGYSMWNTGGSYNLGRTGMGAPTFKSASCGIQLTF